MHESAAKKKLRIIWDSVELFSCTLWWREGKRVQEKKSQTHEAQLAERGGTPMERWTRERERERKKNIMHSEVMMR